MYRYDYILRLIEQLSRALIALRNHILNREVASTEVRAELEAMARQAGIDLAVARRLDSAMLLSWLVPAGDADEAKLWLAGELLYLDALDQRQSDVERYQVALQKALAVFSRLPADWKPSDDLPSAGERASELQRLFADARGE